MTLFSSAGSTAMHVTYPFAGNRLFVMSVITGEKVFAFVTLKTFLLLLPTYNMDELEFGTASALTTVPAVAMVSGSWNQPVEMESHAPVSGICERESFLKIFVPAARYITSLLFGSRI